MIQPSDVQLSKQYFSDCFALDQELQFVLGSMLWRLHVREGLRDHAMRDTI